MKTTGWRSLVLYILGAGLLAGLIFFVVTFFLDGGSWAMRSNNQHLSQGSQLGGAGSITDRDGVVVAHSEDGQRIYADDAITREALLHVVGDTAGFISTSTQAAFRSQLTGYNPVMGVGSLKNNQNGSNIQLTVSSSLSRLALESLGGKNGAIALYNYRTGEVLCMVSSPTFDPLNPPADLDSDETGKYEGVYLNRVLSSTFTPGSIFKIVTSAAAIENLPDIQSRTFHCSGKITVNGREITCETAHGDISFQDGLARSCNIVFAELAMELGGDIMTQTAASMGFGSVFYVDDNPTAKSQYDVSQATEDELAWSGIGQHTDLVNPAHMLILMGAIANDGVPVMPYTIAQVTNSLGIVTRTGQAEQGPRLVQESTAAVLQSMLRYNVTGDYGDSMFPGMSVCAKTGTAEVNGKQPHGWIVGFSQNEDTPFAFAVVVEEGGYGRTSAGNIASALMQAAASSIS